MPCGAASGFGAPCMIQLTFMADGRPGWNMIRSLVIRQSFLAVDAALVVLSLAIGVLVVVKFLEAPVVPPAPPAVAGATYADAVLRPVPPRGEFERILTARLFGDAGAFVRGAVPEAPEPVTTTPIITETELNLRLIGTTATSTLASAIIEDGSQPGNTHAFLVGEAIVDNVTLEEVHPRHVIIHNKQNGKDEHEKLSMDDEKNMQAAVATPTPPVSTSGTDRVNLNRQELMTDLMTNYQDLVKVKPELYRDASGKVVGVTANNIGQIPVAKKLGLSDGDVLQTVNNEQIDSEAKIFEMFTKYQNSNSFRIGIIRNGKPKVVTYRLD